MSYWGMDREDYPGDNIMSKLMSETGLFFTGFYLGPTNDHPESSWMTKRSTLVNQNWRVVPIYVGRQAGSSYFDQGVADAKLAAKYATLAGFPDRTYIYLDVEAAPLSTSFLNYIKTWVKEINDNSHYWPAIYCSQSYASQISSYLSNPICYDNIRYWIAHYTLSNPNYNDPSAAPAPSGSGASNATTWQCTAQTSITARDGTHLQTVDISTSSLIDPSN